MARPHRTHPYSMEASTFIGATSDRIRSRIASSETWPEWQSEILETETPRWGEAHEIVHGKARLLGFDVHGRSLNLPSGPLRFEQDVVVGVRMRVSYALEERAGGCFVTHRLEADLPGGVTGRLLSVVLARRLRRMQQDLLERLRAQLEEELP